jgi:hypothetical protein
MSASAKIRFRSCALALASFFPGGCGRAPSVDILGSFFPAWLICFMAAVLLTALSHLALSRFHIKVELPVLAYPSLTAFLTFALWLIFFH